VDQREGSERVGSREERLAEGVYLRRDQAGRSTSLRIAFQFRGDKCRERLSGLVPTPPNQRYAIRLRGEILNAIARGTFNYADYFPHSKAAKRYGFVASGKTIGDLLNEYEAITRPTVEPSTWLGYRKVIDRCLRPWFGSVRLVDLKPATIRAEILKAEVTLKTARNILSPLNVALRRAVSDGELQANPLDAVDLRIVWPLERRHSGWEPDPFAFDEMGAIFGACDEEESDYWRMAFGTGLRPSEQIELRWPRVDFGGYRVKVEVARVEGIDGSEVKGPKTKAGKRFVSPTQGAWEALERQYRRTGQDDEHVFLDPRYALPWAGEAALRKRWARILKVAEVRYRNPYQTRHTFASALLAAGRPPIWVARQMGHVTTEMLERHYGRWIEQGQNPETRAALAAFFSHPSPTDGKVVAFPL
jgi:integrase